MDTDFLDWALADFSGYVAADELYDGPFCILSAVDHRHYKRILSDVLDHDPDHEDIRTFLGRLKMALTARDLTLVGMTTDGSALYPAPLAELFHGGPHQVCAFHVLAEVVKAVLGAVASARKRLAAQQPKWPKGRPRTQAAKAAAHQKKRLAQQRVDLDKYRHLFVQHHLSQGYVRDTCLCRIGRIFPPLFSDICFLINWLSCFRRYGVGHVICPFYSCISPYLTIKWLNLPSSYLPMFSASYDVGRRDPTNFLLSD
jgi:hypothetical protein